MPESSGPLRRGVIAHEWFEPIGGSETVADAFSSIWPEADVICLWNNDPDRSGNPRLRESWLAKSHLRRSKALSLPLMSRTWRQFDLSNYDWSLVSSHAFAHHLGSSKSGRQIPTYVYAHTPARYLWAPNLDERGQSPAVRFAAPLFRRIDRKYAHSASYAANSQFVRERMRRAWDVDARVIYPPVTLPKQGDGDLRYAIASERRTADRLPTEFILGASRFVSYKRLDLVIRFAERVGLPAIIAGRGAEEATLREMAADACVPVTIVHSPSDVLLQHLFATATCFVFPAIEDFGIMPVEAISRGTPIVANAVGGASETVAITEGGVAIDFSDSSEYEGALSAALTLDMNRAARMTSRFSLERFMSEVRRWVDPDSVRDVDA